MFKSSVLLAAVLAATSAVSAAQINTPTSLVQCQPVLLQWSDAQGTVYVSILPGTETSAAPLVSFAPQTAGTTSIKWVPNLAVGTEVSLSLTDSTGKVVYSAPVTVRAGTDTSCLNSSGSAAADGSTATTGSSSGSGSGSSGSSSGSASSPSSSSSKSGSSGSSTSSAGSASQSSSSSGKSSGVSSFRADTAAMVSSALAVAAAAVVYYA